MIIAEKLKMNLCDVYFKSCQHGLGSPALTRELELNSWLEIKHSTTVVRSFCLRGKISSCAFEYAIEYCYSQVS
jgi:hypothetical protein